MLDNLTQRLAKVVKTMRGEARSTESNTAEMLRRSAHGCFLGPTLLCQPCVN